jgi:hypothetical protein
VAVLGGRPVVAERPGPALVVASAGPRLDATHWQPTAIADPGIIREIVVRGRVDRAAAGVRLRLEDSDGRPIRTVALDPTGHGHGGWVPFEVRFVVAASAPAAYVVTVDADGVPLDDVRHPLDGVGAFLVVDADGRAAYVTQGPEWAQARRPAPSKEPEFGNDGLMGGIVFGIPMAERHGG